MTGLFKNWMSELSTLRNTRSRVNAIRPVVVGTMDGDMGLSTDQANTVRTVWIGLNTSWREHQEMWHLNQRGRELYEKWLAGTTTRQEDLESMEISAHQVTIRKQASARMNRTRSLRDSATAELAPKAVRYRVLLDRSALTDSESEELAELQKWLERLHNRVMATAGEG